MEIRLTVTAEGYAVGNDGSLWSYLYPHNSLKKIWKKVGSKFKSKKNLYPTIGILLENNRRLTTPIHVLVLTTFVGPCPEGLVCRHLDGNGFNNRLDNICWGTQQDNIEDKRRHGTLACGSKHKSSKLSEDDSIAIRVAVDSGATQASQAEKYRVVQSVISKIVNGKTWKHTLPEEIK